ncbi:hypothetical protein T10_5800 [Trichinella papuae]|uniref:Uncharacterized protein n=1 Tax=Trichinella papuae TaxID=268474 RepID=A0A0V1MM87_9BILA|nr:hypothetical protein T10_5800 [Trichinella papuae]
MAFQAVPFDKAMSMNHLCRLVGRDSEVINIISVARPVFVDFNQLFLPVGRHPSLRIRGAPYGKKPQRKCSPDTLASHVEIFNKSFTERCGQVSWSSTLFMASALIVTAVSDSLSSLKYVNKPLVDMEKIRLDCGIFEEYSLFSFGLVIYGHKLVYLNSLIDLSCRQ